MHTLDQLNFSNSFARLPDAFYSRLEPTALEGAHLVSFNAQAAELIDLDPGEASRPQFLHYFGGNVRMPGSEPLAALYAGHQFGHYVPQLGDGRAILLGEISNARGERWELQLKGSGQTPYSRDGDGRAVLRSTIREYLGSEAMHGLGIPTTRALCIIGSTDEVYREQIETGAMLVRMAPSHVRFGSFEVFFHRGQFQRLRELADYVIRLYYPGLRECREPYLEFLRAVVHHTARLVARWQLVGFAHGVMNTDNMSVLGLTLDYGPYGFLDAYDSGFICNHSDRWGRYAFDRQPQVAHWNLSCLAQALLPVLNAEDGEAAAEQARGVLTEYQPEFARAYAQGMRAKLGLLEENPADERLAADLLRRMAGNAVDYTRLFRALGEVRTDGSAGDASARQLFADPSAFDQWAEDYRVRLRAENSEPTARRQRMDGVNPRYVLRNYLAQRAIEQAQRGDYCEVDRLHRLLQKPFDEQPEMATYAAPPPAWERKVAISCSS